MCGIPKVTLEGTLEDWTKLQEKVIELRRWNLDMDFWLNRLDPVICKLIETYKGEIDEDFWARIVTSEGFGSGSRGIVGGWLSAFYPYEKDGEKVKGGYLIAPYDIPDGRVAVPFTTDTGLNSFNLKFIAGFLGAQQQTLENSDEMVVSPIIGWFITDDKGDDKDDNKTNNKKNKWFRRDKGDDKDDNKTNNKKNKWFRR
jgi:hypothetical protein